MLLGGEVDHRLAPTFADKLKLVYPQRGAMLETFEAFWQPVFLQAVDGSQCLQGNRDAVAYACTFR